MIIDYGCKPLEIRSKHHDNLHPQLLPSVSRSVSPPPPLKDYKAELLALQIKMEAEKGEAKMKDEMIKELRADKLHLQQQVTHLEELLKMHVEREEKASQPVKSGKGVRFSPAFWTHTVSDGLCSKTVFFSK